VVATVVGSLHPCIASAMHTAHVKHGRVPVKTTKPAKGLFTRRSLPRLVSGSSSLV
jgi:hypothetical protein